MDRRTRILLVLTAAGLATGCPAPEPRPTFPPRELHPLLESLREEASNPGNPPASTRRSILDRLDGILADQPASYPARKLRAELRIAWGLERQGIEDLAKLVALYGEEPELKALMGVAHYRLGEIDEAQECLVSALDLDRNNAQALFYLGVLLLENGRIDEAGDYFTRALEIDPENAGAARDLEIIKAARSSEALEALVGAGDPSQLKRYGLLLLRGGRLQSATALLLEALRQRPDDRESLKAAAEGFARRRLYRSAEAILRRAVLLDSGDGEARYDLGVARANLAEEDPRFLPAAAAGFEEAAALLADPVPALQAAAKMHAQAGDLQRALESFQAGLRLQPASADFYVDYGLFLARAGSPEGAFEAYRLGLQISPGDQDLLAHYMAACFEDLRFEEGDRIRRQLVASADLTPGARSLLALYSEGDGR